jgi:hypothetical protein
MEDKRNACKYNVEDLKGRNHIIKSAIDGKTVLKWTLKTHGVKMYTGFIWHMIGSGGGFLYTRKWTLGFHQRHRIS